MLLLKFKKNLTNKQIDIKGQTSNPPPTNKQTNKQTKPTVVPVVLGPVLMFASFSVMKSTLSSFPLTLATCLRAS